MFAERNLRNLVALVSLVATVVPVAGCGSGGSVASHRPTEPVIRAEAVAYANAVDLREADVGGWEGVRGGGGELTFTAADVAEFLREGRVDPRRALVSRYSQAFRQQGLGNMRSIIAVMPTKALAAQDARARLSDRAFSSYARAQAPSIIHLPNGRAFDRGPGTVERLSSPLPGVPYSFEWRTTWTTVFGKPKGLVPQGFFRGYEDLLGFVAGPAEILLKVGSDGGIRPLPIGTELQALTAIYRRAETYKL